MDDTRPGVPVTVRIGQIKQPYGGYLKGTDFVKTKLGPGIEELYPDENIPPQIIGAVVDYLTKFMIGVPVNRSFPSRQVTKVIDKQLGNDNYYFDQAIKYEKTISKRGRTNGLSNKSIITAIKLAVLAFTPTYIESMDPNEHTIENVRTMVTRSLNLFDKYGVGDIETDLTFDGGYTNVVSNGNLDFKTDDTILDIHVLKTERLDKRYTLQVLMYWILGLNSYEWAIYPEIKYLAVYNPRFNILYRIETSKISKDTIKAVENDVLCLSSGFAESIYPYLRDVKPITSAEDITCTKYKK